MAARLVAQWHGDRQVTELLLVRAGRVALVDTIRHREVAEQVAAEHGLPLDIRPGAFR